MAKYRFPKAQRKMINAALAAGWRQKDCGNGVLLFAPDGSAPVPVHTTPKRNGHAHENQLAEFRRRGLEINAR